jgi:putative DNA methylase
MILRRQNIAFQEWEIRKNSDLKYYWPASEIPFGHKTHQRDPLPSHGYKYWNDFFNPTQLLVHALFLKAIDCAYGFTNASRDIVLGAFEQYMNYGMIKISYWGNSR